MDPERLQGSTFLWRRLLDESPAWAVAVPVGFALLVLLLVVMFRRERRSAGLILSLIVVVVVSAVYAPLALLFRPMFSWMVVLVPMLAVALFYVGLMYLKDARSIHPVWAAFLGLLRCTVYGILATVFLLPGCQTYDQSVSYPKVLFLFDVSGSMNVIDETPEVGQDPTALPSRQDKIIHFLSTHTGTKGQEQSAFLDRVLKSTDLDLYRFGPVLDEKEVQRLKQGGGFEIADLARWLKPKKADVKLPDGVPEKDRDLKKQELEDFVDLLVSGTNIGGSALQAARLENNSYLQAIVVFSDGNSNVGGDEALQEFLTRVNNPRRTVPVFTVGVGEYRQPAGIRVEDILAPEVVRPDDKFPVRVPVVGTGLVDQEFSVTLEATRVVEDDAGKPVKRDQTYILGPRAGKFKGAGDHPQDTVEFEIDVQDLKKIKASDDKAGDLEGTWEFVARVPRNPREAYPKAEHVSEPSRVRVQKKELRILLFAGGPTREYLLVRPMLFRETYQKRVELSVLLQSAAGVDNVSQDVDKDHMLLHFPDRRGEAKPGESQYTLSAYDAIICFDPDWSQLSKDQLRLLKEWVEKDAGGVVFVAGAVNTYQLARPGGMDLSSLLTIYPVVPKDSRLHGLNLGSSESSHDSSRPHVLHFTPAAREYDFLKLDDKGTGPTAGWDGFFWGGATPEPGKTPRRGIHNYYPVAKLKPDSAVIATFGGPKSTYFEDSDGKYKEQPFLVSMRYGAGKTVYLGAGETWRLRTYKDGYFERFWIKLARYVAAGATMQKKYGNIFLPPTAAVGTINFEAQLRDARQEPLPANAHPVVLVRKVTGADEAKDDPKKEKAVEDKQEMKPRAVDDPKDWEGFFQASVKIREPGKYEFEIPIPGVAASLKKEVIFRKPNPETDNVKNNFDYLYQLASEATKLPPGLPAETRKEIERLLKAPSTADTAEGTKVSPRLFFTLQSADAIAKCLRPIEPKREKVKGPLFDLWDRGVYDVVGAEPPTISSYHLAWGVPLALGVIGFGMLLFMRQSLYAALWLIGLWLASLAVAVTGMLDLFDWPILPIDFSFVLMSVVALLGLEWLVRKLLKLA
jgi:hypothetical protein